MNLLSSIDQLRIHDVEIEGYKGIEMGTAPGQLSIYWSQVTKSALPVPVASAIVTNKPECREFAAKLGGLTHEKS
jgi:hypothetical protein